VQLFQRLHQIGEHPDHGKQDQVFPLKKVGKLIRGAVSVKVYKHQREHRPPRRGNEPGGGRVERVERGIHIFVRTEGLQRHGDEHDDDHARCDKAERRHDAAENAGAVKARIGRHVDADGSGRGLGYGEHVRHIRCAEPAGLCTERIEER